MKDELTILFSQEGCAMCEDISLRDLLKDRSIQERSLNEMEGLALAAFYNMTVKGSFITPALYVGPDTCDYYNADRSYGAGVSLYLENHPELGK